ncbi:cysteine and histidine-rich domain-containing protein morgana [Ischnura elegans]|uniref:cysteine and histidine-rich domain-containing protein morgana n=1 Tax=Ischnura elegans TaxID=197161 RepID=UPI001ED8ACC5|nr:cysteine and histidine-rich domain-containing protein morgana [Ischnura elegans]
MPTDNEKRLLHCYNLGCGQKYDPEENKEDSCVHHPGAPFFHDAYKGWSCCKKKCTDFTEFLNIKGCHTSFHSNVKPPEPEKPVVDKSKADEVIEYKAPQPLMRPSLKRPPLDAPLVELKPDVIAPSLKPTEVVSAASPQKAVANNELKIGMLCKNRGCKKAYEGENSNYEDCMYHPGVPVFHEGLKFWSCCTRRTSDFNAFLEQLGCNIGKHKWFEDKNDGADGNEGNGDGSKLRYRYDWHQTGTHVVVAVYAKNYDPERTTVNLNPVRLVISVLDSATAKTFDLDIPLRGVVDVDSSSSSFLATKIEVKLRKAEPGSWADVALPRKPVEKKPSEVQPENESMEELADDVECVDLEDL